jgi:hypothetical protein
MRDEVALIVVIEKAATNVTLKLSSTIAFYKFRPQEKEREISQTFTLKKESLRGIARQKFPGFSHFKKEVIIILSYTVFKYIGGHFWILLLVKR